MKFCPPIALFVGVYDLLRLKTFLKKIEVKEAEEAVKYGRPAGERAGVLGALGVFDEGELTPIQKARKWILTD